MITKREKWLWGLYTVVLILLFLLSSTDLIIKERKTEVYPVSVIVEDASDDNYINFRKGMEQAAVELNVDVSFVTLYDTGDREQQRELALREQQEGARALVVAPVDESEATQLVEDDRIQVPLVLLNSDAVAAGKQEPARIRFDYFQIGKELGEMILENHPQKPPLYMLQRTGDAMASEQLREGLLSTLKEAEYPTVLFKGYSDQYITRLIENVESHRGDAVVIVALDQESLLQAVQIRKEGGSCADYVEGLYGRGTSMTILNELERGNIDGLGITDDYSAGYLSIQAAVERIQYNYEPRTGYLRAKCIKKQDLRKEENEKMLYPIE